MKYLNMFCRRIAKDLKQKQLLPLKLLFFVHASTLFVLYPYVTIHMRELGISVEETAIMSAVIPVVAIVMPPLAGMLADKIGNFKLLLSVSSSMGGAAALLLLLVPVGRVQVTFPPRAELLVSCQAAGDQLQLLAEAAQYECDPEHPYAYDVEMRVESCGFVCDWILENGSLPLLSSAMSYAVKIRSPSEGATEAFRYPLTSTDLPPISVMTDHTSTRILKNNERYKTTVRRISQNKLFFPTENMYKLTCFNSSEDTPDLSCQFGDNETKIQENDFQRFFMAKVVPLKGNSSDKVLRLSQKKEPKSVKRFRIEGLFKIEKSGNMTKQQSDLIDYPKLACFDNFATLEEEVSIEVLLRPPAPSDPEPGLPAVGETALLQGCKPRCLTTTPRYQLCENTKEDIEIDVSLTFWTYLGGRVFIGIIGGTAFAMFEGAVIAILREHQADYGLQRIYGSIGGMISSPLSGLLIDYVSKGKGYTDFRPAFYLYAVLKVISGALMMTINLEFKSPASNLMKDVTTVLKNVEIVALFVAVFVLGTAWGYIESFLFWLLQDLGGSRSLMGITITVGGIAGIPLLVMSGPIIDKIGHANVLFIGFLFYAIRLTGYSLIYDPWMCLIFEALEGVTSSLAFTAAVTYAARLSTTSTDTSVQGLLGGLYYGVGKGTGSLIGGFLMKAVGTRPTYRIFAVASLVTGCVYFCFNRYFIQKRPQVEGNDICKKKVKQIQTNGKTEKMPLKDAKVNKYLENTPIKCDNKDSYQTGKKEVQNNFSVDAKTSILAKDDDNGNCFTGLDNPTFENEEAPSSGIKAKHSVLEMDRVDDNVKQK